MELVRREAGPAQGQGRALRDAAWRADLRRNPDLLLRAAALEITAAHYSAGCLLLSEGSQGGGEGGCRRVCSQARLHACTPATLHTPLQFAASLHVTPRHTIARQSLNALPCIPARRLGAFSAAGRDSQHHSAARHTQHPHGQQPGAVRRWRAVRHGRRLRRRRVRQQRLRSGRAARKRDGARQLRSRCGGRFPLAVIGSIASRRFS
jgi:hypothetical protein